MATSSATKQPFIAAKFEMDTPSREQLTEQMAMRVYVGGIGDRTQSEEVPLQFRPTHPTDIHIRGMDRCG